MRVITPILVSRIIVDRLPAPEKLIPLAAHLCLGGTTPPVHVASRPDGSFALLNGRHRLAAHLMLRRPLILATYAGRTA